MIYGKLPSARWPATQSTQAALPGDHGLILLIAEPTTTGADAVTCSRYLPCPPVGAVPLAITLSLSSQLRLVTVGELAPQSAVRLSLCCAALFPLTFRCRLVGGAELLALARNFGVPAIGSSA
jgi:hypothetical protein